MIFGHDPVPMGGNAEAQALLSSDAAEKGRGEQHEDKLVGSYTRFFLTLGISGAALCIALLVPSIKVVFELMGGTTSAFVCFILPAAFAIRLDAYGIGEARERTELDAVLVHYSGSNSGAGAYGALAGEEGKEESEDKQQQQQQQQQLNKGSLAMLYLGRALAWTLAVGGVLGGALGTAASVYTNIINPGAPSCPCPPCSGADHLG